MELILQKDVKNLGKAGDQVSVKNGFARNFLLPKGYALLLNKEHLKTWNHQKVIISAKKRKAVSERKILIEKLAEIKLVFEKESQKDNKIFGSVTAHEISQALEKQHNISVDKKDIHFSELKTVGEHKVSIRLDSELKTEILLNIKGKVRKKREEKTSVKPSHLEKDSLSSEVDTASLAETRELKETVSHEKDTSPDVKEKKVSALTEEKQMEETAPPSKIKSKELKIEKPAEKTEISTAPTEPDQLEKSTDLKTDKRQDTAKKAKTPKTQKDQTTAKKATAPKKQKDQETINSSADSPSLEKSPPKKESKKSAGWFKKLFGK